MSKESDVEGIFRTKDVTIVVGGGKGHKIDFNYGVDYNSQLFLKTPWVHSETAQVFFDIHLSGKKNLVPRILAQGSQK